MLEEKREHEQAPWLSAFFTGNDKYLDWGIRRNNVKGVFICVNYKTMLIKGGLF